ncbi:alpha/beta hydrolase [Microbacteriaceae bacterium VKM Ac-2855]|nr:alpha/beta hydrolase [Microbacteriaceae bacterium VKM Ac-2855]
MADRRFVLASGRGVGISAQGDAFAKRTVVFCHPTPGAGAFDPDPLVTASADVQLVMVDRPGYGGSDALRLGERATMQDRADDIAEYLRSYRKRPESIGVVGWSSGGAVALALAARHPDLVDALAVVGTPAPPRAGIAAAPTSAVERLRIGRWAGPRGVANAVLQHGADGLAALGIESDDRALAVVGARNRLTRLIETGSAGRFAGVATDLLALRDGSWAYDLDRVEAETLFIYGDDDTVASIRDGHWLARRVPRSRTVRVLGSGHAAIVSTWRRILTHVAPED